MISSRADGAHRSRCAKVVATVLSGAILCSIVASGARADAVINGELSAEPWAVYLTRDKDRRDALPDSGTCSGSLVAPQWVLTAAHCVAELASNLNDYEVVKPKRITAHVGRLDARTKGKKFAVDRIETRRFRRLASPARNDDDVALLHLTQPSNAKPLWLLPSPTAATPRLPLELHGYGRTGAINDPTSAGTAGTLRRTRPGSNILYPTCAAATDGITCVESISNPMSQQASGDSGGPWITRVDGAPVQALVVSGYAPDQNNLDYQYGETVYNDLTAAWIRSHIALPSAIPGRIVRDPSTAQSWLIDDAGFRRHIPDGGTYECLVARGASVVNLPTATLALMAARQINATCSATECADLANSTWEGTFQGIGSGGEPSDPSDLRMTFDQNGQLSSFLGFPATDIDLIRIDCEAIEFILIDLAQMSGTFDTTRQHVTGTWVFVGGSPESGLPWSATRV